MEESLARLGRFDPARARDRFIRNFDPQNSRHLVVNGERVGVIVVARSIDHIELINLYLYRRAHGRGIGSLALRDLCEEADRAALPIRVTVLKESDAIRFYERHGFEFKSMDDVDCFFVRSSKRSHALPA
jgi:GNAT superfamily N-acetyltransferase